MISNTNITIKSVPSSYDFKYQYRYNVAYCESKKAIHSYISSNGITLTVCPASGPSCNAMVNDDEL